MFLVHAGLETYLWKHLPTGQMTCRLYSPVYIAISLINHPTSPSDQQNKTKLTGHAVLTSLQPRLTNFELYFVKKLIYESLMSGLFPGDENS